MHRNLFRILVVAVTLATLATACGKEAKSDPLDVSGDSGFDSSGVDEPIKPDTGLGKGKAPTADSVVEAALTDVEDFWSRTFEDLYGSKYQPISGGYWAYGPDSEQPPCGDPAPDYSEIAENAFYCPSDDLIAWDNENLIPGMYKEFGGFTIGIVFAHEFGHAIQDRAGIEGDTIMTELQADCFAGAWAGDVQAGNAEHFEITLDDLDKAVAGFLELRDGVGTDAADPAAHGTGFDRIGAFSEGFEQGVERCAEYPDDYTSGKLIVTEIPFTDEADFETGGNLPLDEIVDLAHTDLEDFWTVIFGELGQTWTPVTAVSPIDPDTDTVDCGGDSYTGDDLVNASFYCIDNDTIYLDNTNLIPSLYDVGDYAVATELARQYAYAAQVRLGDTDNTLGTNLQADCYAGIYASSGFLDNRENAQLTLSPGDLDEAVVAFLLTSDSASDATDTSDSGNVSVGTAFERFDSYRAGFVGGLDACDAILKNNS